MTLVSLKPLIAVTVLTEIQAWSENYFNLNLKRQLLLPGGFIYMSPLHNCNVMGTLPLSSSLIPGLVKTFPACVRAGREILQVTSAARSHQAICCLGSLLVCRGTGTTSCPTTCPWPTAPAARAAGNLQGCAFEGLGMSVMFEGLCRFECGREKSEVSWMIWILMKPESEENCTGTSEW